VTRRGWWADHTYHKRSCRDQKGQPKDFFGFIGWKKLVPLVKSLEGETQDAFVVGFFTGGRANEILLLQPRMFRVREKTIRVVGMPAFRKVRWKHYEDGYMGYRNFSINRAEPLTDLLVDLVERKKENRPLFDFKYGKLYRLIADIRKEEGENHGPWWVHRLRAERASQLAEDYRASTYMLKEYFKWSRDETPNWYVSLSMRVWEDAYGVKEVALPEEIQQPPSSEPKSIRERLAELEQRYERGELE